jgi:hypothetical protein
MNSTNTQECMILDDSELNSLGHRIQWRKKGTTDVQQLFNTTAKKYDFPRAFQTYRTGPTTQTVTQFPSFRTVPIKKREQVFTPLTSNIQETREIPTSTNMFTVLDEE